MEGLHSQEMIKHDEGKASERPILLNTGMCVMETAGSKNQC